MSFRRLGWVSGSVFLLALMATPLPARVQDEDCTGDEPRGGRWATSGELYLDRARRNPRPDEKRDLYQQALDVLVEGFAEQPDNPRNYELAGQSYVGLGDYEGADSVYRRAVEMWSCYEARIDTLRYNAWVRAFNRAVQYSQSGDIEKATTEYERAWTVYKKLPQPKLQLGAIYAQQALAADSPAVREEAQEKAIAAYRRAAAALEAEPERLNQEQRYEYGRAATFNLAQLLAMDERYEEAAEAYDRFLAQEPGNVDAITNAAVVLTRAAETAIDSASALEDSAAKAELLAEGETLRQEAVSYYQELLEREDLDAEGYHNVGVGLARLDEYELALEAYTKALDLAPYHERSLTQMALVCFEAGKGDSLLTVARKLVDRYPLSMNNLALLANAYREAEMTDSALATLEQREALPVEVASLELEAGEGVYTLEGQLLNRMLEEGSEVQLKFDFYNDIGEVVTSSTITIPVPPENGTQGFSVPVESPVPISGYAYEMVSGAASQTGS